MASNIAEWTTDIVSPSQRLKYWNGVLCETLFGFSIKAERPNNFEGRLVAVALDSLVVSDSSGMGRIAVRDKYWISHSPSHTYALMVDYTLPWTFVFEGEPLRMQPGDIVLSDTRFEQEAHNPDGCLMRNIRLPVSWLQTWVPEPSVLLGKRIPRTHGWGSALSRWVAQLTPSLAAAPPLPAEVLSDQLGSLLSLVYMDYSAIAPTLRGHERAKADQILSVMMQRRSEGDLTAALVAENADIEVGALHRLLAQVGTTFGCQLQRMRVCLARDLLSASLFDSLSTSEIAKRAGFNDTSHFTRATEKQLGRTPEQIRLNRLR
jgi:AraC family transcriptional activator of tynA and feaB